MKLKEYIKTILTHFEDFEDYEVVNFDIGVDTELNIDSTSGNRVKFRVVKI